MVCFSVQLDRKNMTWGNVTSTKPFMQSKAQKRRFLPFKLPNIVDFGEFRALFSTTCTREQRA
jgi:hypothetical protein